MKIVAWKLDLSPLPKGFRFIKSENVNLDWYLAIKEFDSDLEKRMRLINFNERTGHFNNSGELDRVIGSTRTYRKAPPMSHLWRPSHNDWVQMRKIHSASAKKVCSKRWSNPDEHKKASQIMKQLWKNAEFRTDMSTPEIRKMQAERIKKNWSDPVFKERRRQEMKAKWKDHEYKKLMTIARNKRRYRKNDK